MIDTQNYGQAIGFEHLSITNSVGGTAFTVTKYSHVDVSGTGIPKLNANTAVVMCEGTGGTNDIRWTVDGTAPTASVGNLAVAGPTSNSAIFAVHGRSNINKFRAIRVGGTSGAITVTYYVN